MTTVVEIVTASWAVLLELAPWLLLGTAVASLLHRFVPGDFIQRSFRGRLGVIKAVALGVPLPLCSCGVIPAALGLKKQGASDKAAMGFLISTPQTGADSVLVSAAFLGWPFALFKVLSATVLGIIGGYAVRETAPAVSAPSPQSSERTWRGAFDHGMEVLRTIWRWLVFGVVASALLHVFVPTDGFSQLVGQHAVLAALLVLVISVPLYVCATASVPIAAALVAGGFPLGAALVFLLAGPATNVATIGAVYRTFGGRSLGIYLGTVVGGSILLGLGFDFVLSGAVAQSAMHADHHGPVAMLAAATLTLLLAGFAIDDLRRWLRARRPAPENAVEVSVEGMSCNGCVRKLERALRETEGVTEVEVNLTPGRASVKTRLPAESITRVVQQTGYRVSEPASDA